LYLKFKSNQKKINEISEISDEKKNLDVDAALFSSSRMGVGVVIRNHIGTCLFACSQVFDEVTAPELAEAFAIRRALALVREEGFDKIILSSDCLSVIQRINSPLMDRTGIGC
jgi:ribonuclease HI